jgi:cystathionine beta-lyase/cystathionine gamma-synthase
MQTKLIHSARRANTTRAISPPIWQSTSFEAESAEAFAEIAQRTHPPEYYTRYGNPGHEQVEATLAVLEGGEAALVTASGMGAIFTAVMSLLRNGDHVIAQRSLYASASTLFVEVAPRWGIECTLVDGTRPDEFAAAIRPNTKLIYCESPTNPLMHLTDLRAVAELARPRGITTMVDNTFATPLNQRPLELGIDVVLHSATKYLSGHHDVMAGAIVSSKEFIKQAWRFSIVAGAVLSPFEAWLLLRGMRTLELRVERHNRNALAVAQFLDTHAKIARVNYPGLPTHPQRALALRQMSGFTGILSIELRGGYDAAVKFLKALKLGRCAASLGGFATLLVHPAAMWADSLTREQREAVGVSDSLVRISVGLEDERDLLADFAQALEQTN